MSDEHQADEQVNREAKKWATKIAKENRATRNYTRSLGKWQEVAKQPRKVSVTRDA